MSADIQEKLENLCEEYVCCGLEKYIKDAREQFKVLYRMMQPEKISTVVEIYGMLLGKLDSRNLLIHLGDNATDEKMQKLMRSIIDFKRANGLTI